MKNSNEVNNNLSGNNSWINNIFKIGFGVYSFFSNLVFYIINRKTDQLSSITSAPDNNPSPEIQLENAVNETTEIPQENTTHTTSQIQQESNPFSHHSLSKMDDEVHESKKSLEKKQPENHKKRKIKEKNSKSFNKNKQPKKSNISELYTIEEPEGVTKNRNKPRKASKPIEPPKFEKIAHENVNFFAEIASKDLNKYMASFINSNDLTNFSFSSRKFFQLSQGVVNNQLNYVLALILENKITTDQEHQNLILGLYGLKHLTTTKLFQLLNDVDSIQNKQLKTTVACLKNLIGLRISQKSAHSHEDRNKDKHIHYHYKNRALTKVLDACANYLKQISPKTQLTAFNGSFSIFYYVHRSRSGLEYAHEEITVRGIHEGMVIIKVNQGSIELISSSGFDTLLYNEQEFAMHKKEKYVVSVFLVPTEALNEKGNKETSYISSNQTVDKGHKGRAHFTFGHVSLKKEWLVLTYQMQSSQFKINPATNPININLIKQHGRLNNNNNNLIFLPGLKNQPNKEEPTDSQIIGH